MIISGDENSITLQDGIMYIAKKINCDDKCNECSFVNIPTAKCHLIPCCSYERKDCENVVFGKNNGKT